MLIFASVAGSTNFDHRSFGLNDEVNLVTQEETVAALLEEDFAADLAAWREITLEERRDRGAFERVHEWLGWLIERQQ
jgi:cardiolipin synthase A/B